jgi:hypothetical protein
VTSDTSQLEGKKWIGFSIAPPEVTSSPQRSHPKQVSETQFVRNFRNAGPKLFRSPKSAPKVGVTAHQQRNHSVAINKANPRTELMPPIKY